MSMKRLAVISAVGSHNSFSNQTISYVSSYSGASGAVEQGIIVGHSAGTGSLRTGGHHQGLQTMRPGANLHGNVNIMLGGAMLSVVITVVCFVCYCCHRNIKKRSNSLYRQQWLETEANMEIYSVEQCYDPPPSSGTSGFFMDGSGSGGGGVDYQSLPMVTGAINHTNHLPQYHPYHHHQQYQQQQQQQQQQQHHYQYTLYPNGPPPSYDTVVAQDELLANAASRRKRTLLRNHGEVSEASPGPSSSSPSSSSNSCPVEPEADECDKRHDNCTEDTGTPLLPKAARSPRRWRDHRTSNEHRYGADPADDEPLCAGAADERCHWNDDAAPGAGGATSCCSCPPAATPTPTGRLGEPAAIYCRNCGYFVEGSGDLSRTSASPTLPTNRRPVGAIELTRNEPLLVDYETTGSDVNRNNVLADSCTGAGASDARRQPPVMVSSSASESERLDSANNNNIAVTPNFGMANSANNNIITDSISSTDHPRQGCSDTATATSSTDGNIIHQCPNTSRLMSNQCCNQSDSYVQPDDPSSSPPTTVADRTNGNNLPASHHPPPADDPPDPSGDIRALLDENGLVRLDMSQIIDNTGLPTYEAALKLESSGYV